VGSRFTSLDPGTFLPRNIFFCLQHPPRCEGTATSVAAKATPAGKGGRKRRTKGSQREGGREKGGDRSVVTSQVWFAYCAGVGSGGGMSRHALGIYPTTGPAG